MLLLEVFFPKLNNRRFRFLLVSSEEDEAEEWMSSHCRAIEDILKFCSAPRAVAKLPSMNVAVGGRGLIDPMDSRKLVDRELLKKGL